jgi:hypothetical protein
MVASKEELIAMGWWSLDYKTSVGLDSMSLVDMGKT